jgi:hypothetical protein
MASAPRPDGRAPDATFTVGPPGTIEAVDARPQTAGSLDRRRRGEPAVRKLGPRAS